MKLLDKRTSVDAVKLLIFIVVTTLATGLLVVTIGNLSFAASKSYKAVFSDATGVVKGDDVRVAGVKVGSVEGIDDRRPHPGPGHLQGRRRPAADRQHQRDDPLPQPRRPALHLPDARASARPGVLKEDDTIPLSRTQPGARPDGAVQRLQAAVRALSPADINKLSYEIVTVFQGEGGTLESLLSHTASVTTTLASRDKVIGSLIDNLNQVMVTIGNRDEQLSDLLIKLRQFVSGLSDDRQAILGSLDSISALAVQTSDLVTGHPAAADQRLKQLRERRRQPRPQQGRDRPGPAGAADQAATRSVARRRTARSSTSTSATSRARQVPAGGSPIKELPLDYATNSPRCDLG